MQTTAASRKAGVNAAYDTAKALPGEIHPDVFTGMPQAIKSDLSALEKPVIIDDKLTPFASKMIDDLDNQVGQLKIQNKADPLSGKPPIDPITNKPEPIVGVNLTGVDQMRKRLSALRGDAYGSGNSSDGRAASAVLKAFDDRVDQAVNGGKFTGDPAAIDAWNNARAGAADYKGTFGTKANDPIQKIIGARGNEPLPPNQVVDQVVGSSGLVDNATQVGVAKRLKGILGDQSPEWSAAKQGIFQRLTQNPEGMTPKGTGTIANNLDKFLVGDTAKVIYSPQEMGLLAGLFNSASTYYARQQRFLAIGAGDRRSARDGCA